MPAAQEKPTGLVTTATQSAIEPATLPLSSDSSIILEPTSLAELEQTWRLNASEWKGFLSEDSYLDREVYLGAADMTGNGAATGWLLTSPNLPLNKDGTRPILASCETVKKSAYIAKDGRLEKIISHGIGSVYCRKEYRGRGYAAKMIKELGIKLETWQQLKEGKGSFSVLYSDIGPKFYARHGWKAFPSTHISLKPIDSAEEYHQRRAMITSPHQVDDLKAQDLAELPLTQNVEDTLSRISTTEPRKVFVAFRPDVAVFQWHFMREEFLAEVIGREKPEVKGAIDRKTGIALIWVRTYGEHSSDWHLSILHVHYPSHPVSADDATSSISALLLRAQHQAQIWNMAAGVEVWDPRNDVVAAARAIAHGDEIKVISRDEEHICSLKWNGSDTDDVVWLANERYSWC